MRPRNWAVGLILCYVTVLTVTVSAYDVCQQTAAPPAPIIFPTHTVLPSMTPPPPPPPIPSPPPNPLPPIGGLPPSPNLTPISQPAGAHVLACGGGNGAFQAALNGAAGGTLWIPAGCVFHLNAQAGTIQFPSNTTLACPGDGVTGIHDDSAFICDGEVSMITVGGHNSTVEGCAFTGNYTYSQAPGLQAQTILAGRGCGGGNAIQFTGGGGNTFTDNKVTNQYGDEEVFLGWENGMTVSHNVFAENFSNGVQTSDCSNCQITSNYSVDSNFDIEDAGWAGPYSQNQVWSNNYFTCVQGDGLFLGQANAGYTRWYGGECSWGTGLGCSSSPHPCTAGQYSGVTIEGNTIDGPQAAILGSAGVSGEGSGANIINNNYINGGHLKRS